VPGEEGPPSYEVLAAVVTSLRRRGQWGSLGRSGDDERVIVVQQRLHGSHCRFRFGARQQGKLFRVGAHDR